MKQLLWLLIPFLLTADLLAEDFFDFTIGATKEELLKGPLKDEGTAVNQISGKLLKLSVANSSKYRKNHINGAIEFISFLFDHNDVLYKIKLESDPDKVVHYVTYEYVYNGLMKKLEEGLRDELEIDGYVKTNNEGDLIRTTYFLELFSIELETALHEHLKVEENRRRFTE